MRDGKIRARGEPRGCWAAGGAGDELQEVVGVFRVNLGLRATGPLSFLFSKEKKHSRMQYKVVPLGRLMQYSLGSPFLYEGETTTSSIYQTRSPSCVDVSPMVPNLNSSLHRPFPDAVKLRVANGQFAPRPPPAHPRAGVYLPPPPTWVTAYCVLYVTSKGGKNGNTVCYSRISL